MQGVGKKATKWEKGGGVALSWGGGRRGLVGFEVAVVGAAEGFVEAIEDSAVEDEGAACQGCEADAACHPCQSCPDASPESAAQSADNGVHCDGCVAVGSACVHQFVNHLAARLFVFHQVVGNDADDLFTVAVEGCGLSIHCCLSIKWLINVVCLKLDTTMPENVNIDRAKARE